MREELVTLRVTRYRDPAGNPTCAVNFPANQVCWFYMSQRMGCHETCFFANKEGKYWEALYRSKDTGMLVPLKQCPIWKGKTQLVKSVSRYEPWQLEKFCAELVGEE